ncbi:hypothetical protein Fcan01_23753 [Folsomia candida]|uniref:Uncharacterized protein n=1 Tax=Folsomia candida TaxID=158441 RepID=A0A226D826_FOLCA|nr:hypothetical protein Fcan01_23753 [Folsomia candida]
MCRFTILKFSKLQTSNLLMPYPHLTEAFKRIGSHVDSKFDAMNKSTFAIARYTTTINNQVAIFSDIIGKNNLSIKCSTVAILYQIHNSEPLPIPYLELILTTFKGHWNLHIYPVGTPRTIIKNFPLPLPKTYARRPPYEITIIFETHKIDPLSTQGTTVIGVFVAPADTLFRYELHTSTLPICPSPMWSLRPDRYCTYHISIIEILSKKVNFTATYTFNARHVPSGFMLHHRFVTNPYEFDPNILLLIKAAGYQVIFCEKRHGFSPQMEGFLYKLRSWVIPMQARVWALYLISFISVGFLQYFLFAKNLGQTLFCSFGITVRQETSTRGKLLVTMSLASFFILLGYEAEFTSTILVPAPRYVAKSLPELMDLGYAVAVPKDANPVQHRFPELKKLFPHTEKTKLTSFFHVVSNLDEAEDAFLQDPENIGFTGVFLKGLGTSKKGAVKAYIQRLQKITSKNCYEFEETFSQTMIFWVVQNPLRVPIIRGIKALEAAGISTLLEKYYAYWGEMRVREETGKRFEGSEYCSWKGMLSVKLLL